MKVCSKILSVMNGILIKILRVAEEVTEYSNELVHTIELLLSFSHLNTHPFNSIIKLI